MISKFVKRDGNCKFINPRDAIYEFGMITAPSYPILFIQKYCLYPSTFTCFPTHS